MKSPFNIAFPHTGYRIFSRCTVVWWTRWQKRKVNERTIGWVQCLRKRLPTWYCRRDQLRERRFAAYSHPPVLNRQLKVYCSPELNSWIVVSDGPIIAKGFERVLLQWLSPRWNWVYRWRICPISLNLSSELLHQQYFGGDWGQYPRTKLKLGLCRVHTHTSAWQASHFWF